MKMKNIIVTVDMEVECGFSIESSRFEKARDIIIEGRDIYYGDDLDLRTYYDLSSYLSKSLDEEGIENSLIIIDDVV